MSDSGRGLPASVVSVTKERLNALNYAVDPTGTSDSTTGLQAWINALCAAGDATLQGGGWGILPPGRYKHTGLTIPANEFGWRLEGASRRSAVLQCTTNNGPQFTFAGPCCEFYIGNLALDWSTQQSGNTGAYGFTSNFSSGGGSVYNGTFERLTFRNGYQGLGQTNPGIANPWWGLEIHDLVFDSTWVGPPIALLCTGTGQPRIVIRKFYCLANGIPAGHPLININSADTVEITDYEANLSVQPLEIWLSIAGGTAILKNIRTESGTVSTVPGQGLVLIDGTGSALIDGLFVGSKTFNTGGTNYLARAVSGAVIDLRNAAASGNTLTSPVYLVGDSSAQGIRLGDTSRVSGLTGIVPTDATADRIVPQIRKTGAMTGGTVTHSNTAITANSRILVSRNDGGANPGAWYESGRVVGTSVTFTSTNAADTGTGVYQVTEPTG